MAYCRSFRYAVVCLLILVFSSDASPAQRLHLRHPVRNAPQKVIISLDKTELQNGGSIIVTGRAPKGRHVYLEVWSEQKVRASKFGSDRDKYESGRPNILYMTHDMPAHYKIFIPVGLKKKIDNIKKEGKNWSFSKALRDLGADAVYSAPARIVLEKYQVTFMGSIIGSRGKRLPDPDEKEKTSLSMQLVKARFRSPDNLFAATVETYPDGAFRAEIKMRQGLVPGAYTIVAATDKDTKSEPAVFRNNINFPLIYLKNSGTSLNIFGPFFLTLVVAIFGVLMGAGGGFIINPLLVSIWPLPHTVVAGTVMPTVLFSQSSGIYNYSKIKFINWKLGIAIGASMVAGGFIGPKLTELITLEQFKFVFGWILIVLAGLMFWQTTPGYLERNKKEQHIMKEFMRKAEAAARAGAK